MIANVESMHKFGKAQMDAVTAASTAMTKGMQDIADETTTFSKKFFEMSSSAFQELLGAEALDKALEIQTNFAKQTQESLIAQTTKVSEIYMSLAKEVAKPFQGAFAGVAAETTATRSAEASIEKPTDRVRML